MRRVALYTILLAGAFTAYAVSRAPSPPNTATDAPARRPPIANTPLSAEVLNGLATNGLFQDLGRGTLTSTTLQNVESVRQVLAFYPKFIKYLVECALPPDQTIMLDDGEEVHEFHGGVGLAPEWATGPCEQPCQEWVSACLLARTNIYEIPVRIYMAGVHPALTSTSADDPDFSVDEGGFYGNLFDDPPRTYTCRGTGNDPLYFSTRVCTLQGNRCSYEALGACGAIDGDTGLPTRRHACEALEAGNYRRCHNRLSIEGSEEFPEPNRVYDRVISLRVRKSTFGGGVAAGCLGGAPDGGVTDPPDSGVPPNDGGVTAGRHCMNDEDCDSDLLVCDVRSPQAMCTAACTNVPNQSDEQAQCGGPGTTCLSNSVAGFCTRACTAGRTETNGGCTADRVCSGLWINNGIGAERAGCYPLCRTDADCTQDTSCNPRTGSCGPPLDMSKLSDGEPCTPPADVCRGACVLTSSTADQTLGQCVSFVNLARTRRCPDDFQRIFPASPTGDDLAVCVFKNCASSSDCTPPLVCRLGPTGARVCLPR